MSASLEGGFILNGHDGDEIDDGQRVAKRARLDTDQEEEKRERASTPEPAPAMVRSTSSDSLSRLMVPAREREGSSPRSGSSSPGRMPDSPRPNAKREREHRQRTGSSSPERVESTMEASTLTARAKSPASSPRSGDEQTQRRVKVYRLQGEAWDDLGTGWCSVWSDPPPKRPDNAPPSSSAEAEEEGPWIVVRPESTSPTPGSGKAKNEDEPYTEIWRSGVRSVLMLAAGEQDRGSYQRQQDTLIVWTEPDGTDMALSFASQHGCNDVWEIIDRIRAQMIESGQLTTSYGHDQPSSPELGFTSSPPSGAASAALSAFAQGEMPDPTLGTLEEVETVIKWASRTALGREKLANAMINTGYVRKLITVLDEAEDLESLRDLHKLCLIMQNILLLNDNNIFEYVMNEEIFFGMLGMLEYDPEYPRMKASYRAQLSDPNRFREVVPIKENAIKAKIHQTYRLQYLKDVVLARVIDDQTFSMLNSFIFYHQVDIVTHLQHNSEFLAELFAIHNVTQRAAVAGRYSFENGAVTETVTEEMRDRQRDALLFWQSFCSMAKNLQVAARTTFYRQMCERGLLRVIEVSLDNAEMASDPGARTAAVEILVTLIDHDPASVRSYCLAHNNEKDKDRSLLSFLIELFQHETDLGIKAQMTEAIRILVQTSPDPNEMSALMRGRQTTADDPETEKFLGAFYEHHVGQLFSPLLALSTAPIAADGLIDLDNARTALFAHLADLLCYFVGAHTFRSKYYVLSSTIAQSTARLFKTRLKHLRLAALRFFRACLAKGDEFYNRFLIKHELFLPIVELAQDEAGRENLLSSASLEFFEHVRSSNVKGIINHLVDKHGEKIRKLAETEETFKGLITVYERNNAPPPESAESVKVDEGVSAVAPKKETADGGASWTGGGKPLDVEEESYWASSDEEETPTATIAPALSDESAPPLPKLSVTTEDDDDDLLSAKYNPRIRTATSAQLNNGDEPPRKRARPSSEESSVGTTMSGMVRSPAIIFAEMREKGGKVVNALSPRRTGGLVDYNDAEDEKPLPPTPPRISLQELGKRKRETEEEERDEKATLAAARRTHAMTDSAVAEAQYRKEQDQKLSISLPKKA